MRALLMTGEYSARLHLTDFIAAQYRSFEELCIPSWMKRLHPREMTVAEALNELGYAGAYIGKWHLGASGQLKGLSPETFLTNAQCAEKRPQGALFANQSF